MTFENVKSFVIGTFKQAFPNKPTLDKFTENEEGKEKTRKPRAPKVEEEVTEWNEGDSNGVSIADLLNKNS